MRSKMFVVYDSKVGAYMLPHFMQSAGQAIRSFTDAVNAPDSMFGKHPGDYTLFEIGEYDELLGTTVMHVAKVNLGTAIDFVRSSPQTLPMFPGSLKSSSSSAVEQLNSKGA